MKQKREDILGIIIDDVKSDLDDEEIIHMLLDKKVSKDGEKEEDTLGQVLADKIAQFAGSWIFIGFFVLVLISWMVVNVVALNNNGFDPYPFILLNLVLSCIAAVQAPLIMMSQNRQEVKDRRRSENDYKVNLKTEIIMADLHGKLDVLLENQEKIIKMLESDK